MTSGLSTVHLSMKAAELRLFIMTSKTCFKSCTNYLSGTIPDIPSVPAIWAIAACATNTLQPMARKFDQLPTFADS